VGDQAFRAGLVAGEDGVGALNALGLTPDGDEMDVDLDNLIGSHLCVAANSGGGKSGVIRRLLEVTHGRVQQIVLDAEDEFYTLRERFDYVIAGGDGDAPATVANARGLATAALSHDFSLIAQINDLDDDAGEFIAEFITGLLSAPRELWRPVLVVIDEAQRFAPSGAPNEATAAIKSLLQRGRKRGFTAVVATTRFSELNAGVRGLCNNWLLGLVGQSLDRNTAADQLGFGRNSAEAKGLQSLERRQFWAFGPALSRTPVLFRVADTETTIIKHGQARVPTPPAPEALRAILSGLVVPSAADDSERAYHAGEVAWPDQREHVKQLVAELGEQADALDRLKTAAERAYESGKGAGVSIGISRARSAIDALRVPEIMNSEIPAQGGGGPEVDEGQTEGRQVMMSATPRATAPAPAARTATEKAGGGNASPADTSGLSGRHQKILDAIAWWSAIGIKAPTSEQVGFVAGYVPSSGNFKNLRGALNAAGLVHYPAPGTISLTEAGCARAANPLVAPTRAAFHAAVRSKLEARQLRLLDPVLAAYPGSLTTDQLADAAEYVAASGNFKNLRGSIRTLGLIEYPRPGEVRAADWLFPGGAA
jgi:hypothetical protein